MLLGDIILNILFYLFAIVAMGGALAVAASRNIVRSAFALLAVLFSAAAFYALMQMDFIVAVQILIYVGGILVLIIFAIMLTHKITDINVSNESAPSIVTFFASVCVLFAIVMIILYHKWSVVEKKAEALTAKIGELLANEYLLPFEIISVLLLAALIGAAFLARKEVKE